MQTSKEHPCVARCSQVEGEMPVSIACRFTIRDAYKVAIKGLMQHSATMAIKVIDVGWSHVMKHEIGKTED